MTNEQKKQELERYKKLWHSSWRIKNQIEELHMMGDPENTIPQLQQDLHLREQLMNKSSGYLR